MLGRHTTNPTYSPLRWVVLLLTVAVILPTVCLLWFMGQVVANERLAIRQKLIAIYREQLGRAVEKTDEGWLNRFKPIDLLEPNAHPYTILSAAIKSNCCNTLIIYDAGGKCLYPQSSADTQTLSEPSAAFSSAWKAEFVDRQFERAAELYGQMASSPDDYTRLAALIGKSRCKVQLGAIGEAVEACRQAALWPAEQKADAAVLTLVADARLLMLRLIRGDEQRRPLYEETFKRLVSMLYSPNEAGFSLRADKNLFIAQKILTILEENSALGQIAGVESLPDRLTKLISSEELSLQVAEDIGQAVPLQSHLPGRLRKLPVGGRLLYGFVRRVADRDFLVIFSPETLQSLLTYYEGGFADSYVDYRLVDESGSCFAGAEQPKGEPFASEAASRFLPGWKVELYFRSDTFERAASERIAVYVWTGLLVILLILLSGAFAAKAIVSQVRLSRLKNDFIATVTHELKTPLASMRVLVDTLLEGHYRDQQQVVEYLQLISTENVRLSRLIDNFLTFSRMERNKKAFQLADADPAAIALAAAEAVRTKFSNERCRFTVDMQQNLPVVAADHDAMVTVLVNLLDNACKYSYDDKNIELKVAAANGFVEFRVHDNGIGLSRRSIKKIFTKFYQVDRSLSRRTGGCGLGLSIAKFIVDAHKGSISVESKLNQGSTFTVRLPCGKHP